MTPERIPVNGLNHFHVVNHVLLVLGLLVRDVLRTRLDAGLGIVAARGGLGEEGGAEARNSDSISGAASRQVYKLM